VISLPVPTAAAVR